MLIKFIVFSLFLFPVYSQVKVEIARGEVKLDGKFIRKNETIDENGTISVGKNSFCKVKFVELGSSLVVGPNSSLVLKKPKKGRRRPTLVKGLMRFVSGDKKGNKEPNFYTKQVAAGIRGTDFMLVSNPLLGETEIVMFDGRVKMYNRSNKKDILNVKKGQWGGLGGRFGAKFQPPIDLPENVINHFNGALPVK
ncbi:MAG: FecR family protein [Halobacteriovoraceae bacterium]|nr:FecR family protein [Halobacteriovoraceae bacterium]